MNFLFRRRFLQNVGFQLQQRPAPNLYPLSTLSLSYFLSFYPFSLLLLRLTMTHDACVWIIQNPPINNKKTANHQLFQHVRFCNRTCHSETISKFSTSTPHSTIWFSLLLVIVSCFCHFRLVPFRFLHVLFPIIVLSNTLQLLSSIWRSSTFISYSLNETSGNFSSFSLLFSVSLTNHYVFFSCVIRLCFRSLFSTLNTYKLEHTLPLFGRYTNQQTSTHSHKSVFKNGPPTVQDAALVLRADAEARPGQVRWNKWSAEGIIHCFSSNSFFLSPFYTHSVKLLNHVLFFLCTCVFFANIFLNTFYLLRSLLRVTFCSN